MRRTPTPALPLEAGGRSCFRRLLVSGWTLAVLGLCAPAAAQTPDDLAPGWRGAYDFLVTNVCVSGNGQVLPGFSPLDGPAACPGQRKIQPGERLPYHKRDWTPDDQRGAGPNGYQQSDSFPIRTALGTAVVQTYDFGDRGSGRAYGRFDSGDGGQVAFFSAGSAAFGITEDGGAGLQLFIGPACTVLDSWVIVDASFGQRPSGETLARITRDPARCRDRLGYAYTRWHVQPVRYNAKSRGRLLSAELTTLVSDHFGGRSAAGADHLERFYFTRELGHTRWERWQNFAVHDRPEDRRQAADFARTNRCEPQLGPPQEGGPWLLLDCRQWTILVPPTEPAGDLPDFWIGRLREDQGLAALLGN